MRERMVRFGLIGIFNTFTSFVLFNIFIFLLHWSIGLANIVATAITIVISFWLNARFVFPSSNKRKAHRVFILFLTVTTFSQFVVQQAALLLFLHSFTWPAHTTIVVARRLPEALRLSDTFYRANVAKCLAIAISMTVNFVLYDRVVFTQSRKVASHMDGDKAEGI